MLYAAIDIHKHAFQAAVLDAEGGEVVEARFSADRESLARWADEWQGRLAGVAIEATTGWRWVWRELSARGFDVRLAEPVQARALLGRHRIRRAGGHHSSARMFEPRVKWARSSSTSAQTLRSSRVTRTTCEGSRAGPSEACEKGIARPAGALSDWTPDWVNRRSTRRRWPTREVAR